ncbi:MAG TPA: hypothetical protein VGM29_09825 [Polyangiaceae bacterium]
MEIKIYTLKLSPPRWLRNTLVYAVLPVGALLGAAVTVRAAVTLTTFTSNTPIKAADVNANFTNLNTAITALQTSSALLYGVAGPVVTTSGTTDKFTVASCGATGRIVTGFCVTNPPQPVVAAGMTGLWKYGPYDSNVGAPQTAANPVLSSLWVCDVSPPATAITIQAYAVCMKAP